MPWVARFMALRRLSLGWFAVKASSAEGEHRRQTALELSSRLLSGEAHRAPSLNPQLRTAPADTVAPVTSPEPPAPKPARRYPSARLGKNALDLISASPLYEA
jgi:hypothetical protein